MILAVDSICINAVPRIGKCLITDTKVWKLREEVGIRTQDLLMSQCWRAGCA